MSMNLILYGPLQDYVASKTVQFGKNYTKLHRLQHYKLLIVQLIKSSPIWHIILISQTVLKIRKILFDGTSSLHILNYFSTPIIWKVDKFFILNRTLHIRFLRCTNYFKESFLSFRGYFIISENFDILNNDYDFHHVFSHINIRLNFPV